MIKNTAVRLTYRPSRYEHILSIIHFLYWLPVMDRIVYKLSTLTLPFLALVLRISPNSLPSVHLHDFFTHWRWVSVSSLFGLLDYSLFNFPSFNLLISTLIYNKVLRCIQRTEHIGVNFVYLCQPSKLFWELFHHLPGLHNSVCCSDFNLSSATMSSGKRGSKQGNNRTNSKTKCPLFSSPFVYSKGP